MTRHYIIPIFVPHFGCPNDCIFCNQRKITGLSTNLTPEDAERIITDYLETFSEDSFIEIAFYGGSFTAIDFKTQKNLLAVAYRYKKLRKVDEIRLSTRPDAIDPKILSTLREFDVDTIELGVQSLDDKVLFLSDRGHNSSQVYRAVNLIKEFNFKLGLQMMLGLPGDTRGKSIDTALAFIELQPDCVRIYPTLVIRNTNLEKDYIRGAYKPLSLDGAVELSTILLLMFKLSEINVIRLGLQPTENIQLGKDVVAGPFHPSFRQLVESNILRSILEKVLDRLKFSLTGKELLLEINARSISNLAGQKSSNKNYLIRKYGLKKIKILSKNLDKEYIDIKIDGYRDRIYIREAMGQLLNDIY